MYKVKNNKLYFFLVHPGGPFFKNKDEGYWSIPKGEVDDEKEGLINTAIRELEEETGIKAPEDIKKYTHLGTIKQKSGKIVHCWAFEGDWLGFFLKQEFIEIEYPPKSRKKIKIPEVDRADFFTEEKAKTKIIPEQFEFIERLKKILKLDKRWYLSIY